MLDGFAGAGYEPVRTPILEFTELHERKSGAGIVSKLFEVSSGGPAGILPARRALTSRNRSWAVEYPPPAELPLPGRKSVGSRSFT